MPLISKYKNCTTYNELRVSAQTLVIEAINDAIEFINDISEEDSSVISVDSVINHSLMMLCNILEVEADPNSSHISPTLKQSVIEIVTNRLSVKLDL